MLRYWIEKKILSASLIRNIDEKTMQCNEYIPCEFARKTRPVYDFERWKANELRLFLLYVGPVVLQNTLPKRNCRPFALFSTAVRKLCDKFLSLHSDKIFYAEILLRKFVHVNIPFTKH